jgi:hypothetical protein
MYFEVLPLRMHWLITTRSIKLKFHIVSYKFRLDRVIITLLEHFKKIYEFHFLQMSSQFHNCASCGFRSTWSTLDRIREDKRGGGGGDQGSEPRIRLHWSHKAYCTTCFLEVPTVAAKCLHVLGDAKNRRSERWKFNGREWVAENFA